VTNDTLKLTDQEVLQCAHAVLAEHLPLQADGYTCTTDDLLDVLLGVAANRGTMKPCALTWLGYPTPKRFAVISKTNCVWKTCPSWNDQLNGALLDEFRRGCGVKPAMWRLTSRPALLWQTAAGDWPVVRGQARDGTTRFYRVITAYVMLNHLRVTLVIRFVLPNEDIVQVLKDVLKRAKRLGIQIARLFWTKALPASRCRSI